MKASPVVPLRTLTPVHPYRTSHTVHGRQHPIRSRVRFGRPNNGRYVVKWRTGSTRPDFPEHPGELLYVKDRPNTTRELTYTYKTDKIG